MKVISLPVLECGIDLLRIRQSIKEPPTDFYFEDKKRSQTLNVISPRVL